MRRQYCSRIFFMEFLYFFYDVKSMMVIFFSIDDLVPKWKILRMKTN